MSQIQFNLDREINKNNPNGIYLYKTIENLFGIVGENSFCSTDINSVFNDDVVIVDSILNISDLINSSVDSSIEKSICNISDADIGGEINIDTSIFNISSSAYTSVDFSSVSIVNSMVNSMFGFVGGNDININESNLNNIILNNSVSNNNNVVFTSSVINNAKFSTNEVSCLSSFLNQCEFGLSGEDNELYKISLASCFFNNTTVHNFIEATTNLTGVDLSISNSYLYNFDVDFSTISNNTNDLDYMVGYYIDNETLDWYLGEESASQKMVLNGDLFVTGNIKTRSGGSVGNSVLKEAVYLKEDDSFDYANWDSGATIEDGSYYVNGSYMYIAKNTAYNNEDFSTLLNRVSYYNYMNAGDILAFNVLSDGSYVEIALSSSLVGVPKYGSNVVRLSFGQNTVGLYSDLVGNISLVNTKVNNNSNAVVASDLVMFSSNGSDITGTTSQTELFITDTLVKLQFNATKYLQFTDTILRVKYGDGSLFANDTQIGLSHINSSFDLSEDSVSVSVSDSNILLSTTSILLKTGLLTSSPKLLISDTDVKLQFSDTNYLELGSTSYFTNSESELRMGSNSLVLESGLASAGANVAYKGILQLGEQYATLSQVNSEGGTYFDLGLINGFICVDFLDAESPATRRTGKLYIDDDGVTVKFKVDP